MERKEPLLPQRERPLPSTKAFVVQWLSLVGFISIGVSFAGFCAFIVFLCFSIDCKGVDLRGPALTPKERRCRANMEIADPIASEAVAVGLFGFILFSAIFLPVWPLVECRMKKPALRFFSLTDEESSKALRKMFARSGSTVSVRSTGEDPFELRDGPARFSMADYDVRGICVSEMDGSKVQVDLSFDSSTKTIEVVPRQGWSAARVREELCAILLGESALL